MLEKCTLVHAITPERSEDNQQWSKILRWDIILELFLILSVFFLNIEIETYFEKRFSESDKILYFFSFEV